MDHFPLPYPNELLYSTIGRAGVHHGLISPKDLLWFVFKNRKVISTIGLPGHLMSVLQHYSECKNVNLETLIYKHTLFPLYAPFVQQATKIRCINWLKEQSLGSVHLALGIVTSKIKKERYLRYCPSCLTEQFKKHGEYFWQRDWQVPGVDSCFIHGALVNSKTELHGIHRHQYFDANPDNCPILPQCSSSPQSENIAKQVRILLDMNPISSPTYEQWTCFYYNLIQDNGDNKGKYICYELIQKKVLRRWTSAWLKDIGLELTDKQSCWLRSIYRKHRNAFSFLEHIIALNEYMPPNWRIDEVINRVLNTSKYAQINSPEYSEPPPSSKLTEYRVKWVETVSKFGVKVSRQVGCDAIYMWLYRHDKDWFFKTNKEYRMVRTEVNTRVCWPTRDKHIVRKLLKIKNQLESNLTAKRWSANWFYKQFSNASTIEKNLTKLPLTELFLNRYVETVEDYQIRRLTRAIANWQTTKQPFNRCYLLRDSGLSEERLRPLSNSFLREVVGIECKASRLNNLKKIQR